MSMMRNILLKSFILFCLAVSAIGCRQRSRLCRNHAAAGSGRHSVAVFGKTGADPIVVCGNRTLAEHRFPPCSTFKIVSTLMGLDSGVRPARRAVSVMTAPGTSSPHGTETSRCGRRSGLPACRTTRN